MSVFRVKLNNMDQGKLDLLAPTASPGLGSQALVSSQRQAFIMGPGKCQRLMVDGETFTDCNYYKKFCVASSTNLTGTNYENAILEIVTDDGNEWSDTEGGATQLTSTHLHVLASTDYAANEIDFITSYGGPAIFIQMENTSGADDVSVKINDRSAAIFTLGFGDTQVFNRGDLTINKVQFANTASGAGNVIVNLMFSIESQCYS